MFVEAHVKDNLPEQSRRLPPNIKHVKLSYLQQRSQQQPPKIKSHFQMFSQRTQTSLKLNDSLETTRIDGTASQMTLTVYLIKRKGHADSQRLFVRPQLIAFSHHMHTLNYLVACCQYKLNYVTRDLLMSVNY